MIYIKLLLTILLPFTIGASIVLLIYKKKAELSLMELFSLAWGIGIGLTGLIMFIISILGIKLNLLSVFAPLAIIAISLLFFVIKNHATLFDIQSLKSGLVSLLKSKKSNSSWLFWAQIALITLILLTIIGVFFDALIKPIVNFDDLWRQGCIAKIIFSTGKVITDQSVQLAGPHPYLNPLSQAFIYFGIGEWNDALGKVIFPLCFTALLFVFYANLRKYSTRFHALLFTYLLTSFPLIVYHSGTAYSDLMQTFYYTIGALYLYRWFQDEKPPFLYISALFWGIGTFVKQSGIPFWVLAIFVLFIYLFSEKKKDYKPGYIFALISSIISLPWLFY